MANVPSPCAPDCHDCRVLHRYACQKLVRYLEPLLLPECNSARVKPRSITKRMLLDYLDKHGIASDVMLLRALDANTPDLRSAARRRLRELVAVQEIRELGSTRWNNVLTTVYERPMTYARSKQRREPREGMGEGQAIRPSPNMPALR